MDTTRAGSGSLELSDEEIDFLKSLFTQAWGAGAFRDIKTRKVAMMVEEKLNMASGPQKALMKTEGK